MGHIEEVRNIWGGATIVVLIEFTNSGEADDFSKWRKTSFAELDHFYNYFNMTELDQVCFFAVKLDDFTYLWLSSIKSPSPLAELYITVFKHGWAWSRVPFLRLSSIPLTYLWPSLNKCAFVVAEFDQGGLSHCICLAGATLCVCVYLPKRSKTCIFRLCLNCWFLVCWWGLLCRS